MTNIPKITFKRNEFGLLEHVDYKFLENGFINWRAMISPEFLVPNGEVTSETNIDKLSDREILILLGGLKALAQIRGYSKVEFHTSSPSPDFVIATCTITWIGNFETEGREIVFSSVADASIGNTNEMTASFLASTAENRAFARTIRNFLKINICSKEELALKRDKNNFSTHKTESAPLLDENKQIAKLKGLMKDKGVSLEMLNKRLTDENTIPEPVEKIEQLSRDIIFSLIERLGKIKP